MAVQLGLSAARHHPLGVRSGEDRRQHERRGRSRGGPDRRRGERRRTTFSNLLFSALTVAFPAQLNLVNLAALRAQLPQVVLTVVPSASVSVAIDSFVPVSSRRAYEALIREAATRYQLETALIRSVMQTESAFNPVAVSDAGALGLMQLMPALALELGVTDPFRSAREHHGRSAAPAPAARPA